MWNLIRAINDESKQSAFIVIEKDEQMYTGWRAANCFIEVYQETSTLKIPHSRRHEVNDEMKRLQREEPCPEKTIFGRVSFHFPFLLCFYTF